jgi:phosphatidylglycerophosphate synthase
MLDNKANKILKPIMVRIARFLLKWHIKADTITLLGFGVGLLGILAIANGYFGLGLCFILINRIFDGLDGAIARESVTTDAGGYLDIVLDFVFYSGIVLAFIFANASQNAVAAGLLLFSFMGTGASFLAFAAMAERYQIADKSHVNKAIHYVQGITEGTETIIFFVLFCLFPQWFPVIAYIFALLCIITTITRVYDGYRLIQIAENNKQ